MRQLEVTGSVRNSPMRRSELYSPFPSQRTWYRGHLVTMAAVAQFLDASERGDLDTVQACIRAGQDVNATGTNVP